MRLHLLREFPSVLTLLHSPYFHQISHVVHMAMQLLYAYHQALFGPHPYQAAYFSDSFSSHYTKGS